MRFQLLAAFSIVALGHPGGAYAQLRSESVQGLARICSYSDGAQPILTGPPRVRQYQVGIGQNCPSTYPFDASAGRPLPATARLAAEDEVGEGRRCRYEEAGMSWLRYLPLSRRCPVSAGLLPPDELREAPIGELPR